MFTKFKPIPANNAAKFAENKGDTTGLDHVIDIQENTELYYFAKFSQKELEELCDKDGKSFIKDHHKTVEQLEKIIAEYWKTQWYFRVENWFANASNLLYVIFQINTAGEGVPSLVNAFIPNVTIDPSVSAGIGIPTALLSTSLYTLAFSAYRQAIIETLQYAHSTPYCERPANAYLYAKASPMGALTKTLGYLFNTTTLLVTNLTGTMSEIVDISDKINALPTPLNWLVILSVLYFGNKYYKNYMNQDYYNGLKNWIDFLSNKDNQPWLLAEIAQGNIATPIQVFLQGISAIGLRTYPLFYYLSLASATALGGWIPAPLVAALVTWHSLCALYPETYKFYMHDKIKVRELIREKIKPLLELLKQTNPNLTEKELEAAAKKEFNKIRKEYEAEIIREHGRAYVLKQPFTVMSIACRTAIGGYLGWQSGVAATVGIGGIAIPIVGTIVSASVLGGLLYRAEAERIMDKFIHLHMEEEKNGPEEKVKPTCCETASDAFAKLINITNGIVMATSMMGTVKRVIEMQGVPPVTAKPLFIACSVAAIERGAQSIVYNEKKVEQTTRDVFVPVSCSSSPHAIFNHTQAYSGVPAEEKAESIELQPIATPRQASPV